MQNQMASVNLNANHVQFYMTAGQLENELLLTANRRLYEALKEKEYQTTYEEFQDGHDGIWWREKLSDGLRTLKYTKTTL